MSTSQKVNTDTSNNNNNIENNNNYSGDLKSGLVWILVGQKEVGLQMARFLDGNWNPEAQTSEIHTNVRHLSKIIWNLDKNVQILNGPVFKWLRL